MIDRIHSPSQATQSFQPSSAASRLRDSAQFEALIREKSKQLGLKETPASIVETTPQAAASAQNEQPLQSLNFKSRITPKDQYYERLNPMIKEVQQIAEASGFVGVNSSDVLRAYQQGTSFLADYKV
jgi:hypothetical protein